jgi:hypothetical protein
MEMWLGRAKGLAATPRLGRWGRENHNGSSPKMTDGRLKTTLKGARRLFALGSQRSGLIGESTVPLVKRSCPVSSGGV